MFWITIASIFLFFMTAFWIVGTFLAIDEYRHSPGGLTVRNMLVSFVWPLAIAWVMLQSFVDAQFRKRK